MSRVKNKVSQKLHAYLASKGAEPWIAKFISDRFASVFNERAYDIIGAFEQAGWNYEEIFWLDSKSHEWRKQPEHVFMLQLALQGAGCTSVLARRLVMEPLVFEIQDLERIAACMRAMQELGWHEPQIRFATLRKPRILTLPPEALRIWHRRFQDEGKDPILYLHTLSLLMHESVKELNKSKPAKQETECMPIVATFKEPELPLPTPLPSIELQAKLDAEPAPIPKPEQVLETSSAPIPEPGPTPVPVQPKPEPVPLKLILQTPAPEIDSQREYVSDDKIEVNWKVLAKQILDAVAPDWNERKWAVWLKINPRIDETCQQTRNLDQILRWVRFFGNTVPCDRRTRLIASVLLNRNLPLEIRERKRKLKLAVLKRSDPVAYALRILFKNKKARPRAGLSSILEIPEMALYLRFYALRRVLECEPMSRPELLCLPFEQVLAQKSGSTRCLSILPPTMTGQDASRETLDEMQAKLDEIRFRTNTVRDKGMIPWRKPYINMILEPTQEKFLKRLNSYLKKHGSKIDSSPKFRRNKQPVTPFSPLS